MRKPVQTPDFVIITERDAMSIYKITFLLYGTLCLSNGQCEDDSALEICIRSRADLNLACKGRDQRSITRLVRSASSERCKMGEDRKHLEAWLEGVAPTVGLKIPDAYRDDVVSQLALNHSLIQPLLDFEFPATDLDK